MAIPPSTALWAVPAGITLTWFIWDALNDDIKQSVGLYYDPDAVMKRVEMERTQRLEAKEALKAASKPAKEDEDDDEDEDEEEEVTAETIEAVVNKAIGAVGDDDDEEEEEDEDAPSAGDDDDDEEEEEEKPKAPKVDFDSLSTEEKWEYFAERAVIPGEDDEDEDGDVSETIVCRSFFFRINCSLLDAPIVSLSFCRMMMMMTMM